MKSHDATLIVAAAALFAVGTWCDAGWGDDREGVASARAARALEGLQPLASVVVPRPHGGQIIDNDAAVVLGKALFWDQQAGSDGTTACATCHSTAGADARRFNVVNPGPNGRFEACGTTGASQITTACDHASDDRLGSQGVVAAVFTAIAHDGNTAADECTPAADSRFGAARQVTARNAPSVVSAIFYRDAFWDGRANHVFNGVDAFGETRNATRPPLLAMGNGALASQATGMANDSLEMSCAGRPFNGANGLAAKLLARRPLGLQRVSRQDSVLGRFSAAPNRGLMTTYRALIIAAFGPSAADEAIDKFSTYWGQSIQAYEATLIPNETPFDKYLSGNKAALTANQRKGMERFAGKAGCTGCHAGPELSDATVGFFATRGGFNEDGGDQGFHNTGVRPTAEDEGRAARGPADAAFASSGSVTDAGSAGNRGAFKTPQLRNVKLTAPYFHNGGKATLRGVVELYNAGGDFPNAEKSRRMKHLGLDARDIDVLVDFLNNGLTDCRTEKERAPFDHPSLATPDGPTLPAVGAAGTGSCP